MKILFISFFNGELKSGGNVCSNRNFKSLKSIYGEGNVFLFPISRAKKGIKENKLIWNLKNIFVDVFGLGFGGLNNSHKRQIMGRINELNIDVVFIDSSLLGVLSMKIKKELPKIKIVTFFHNVEYSFFCQDIIEEKKYFLFYRILLAYISERLACKYSDKIITLNQRDDIQINSIYNRKSNIQIPISLENKYNSISQDTPSKVKVGLFVGSFFFPNIQGIKWFIKNVLPFVDMELNIVGKDMDQLNQDILVQDSSNIIVHSSVPNLTEYYEKADFVILPIFLGGGMKVKTAEALMYGKFLLGTKEAFVGYEIGDNIGLCCDTPNEMINGINCFNRKSKYNIESKQLFLEKYSFESTLNKFQMLFSSL